MTEKIKLALEKINEAGHLFKEEWDEDVSNHRAAGCYKAINAIRQTMSEKDDEEKDENYTFTRLVEAMSWFADYYGITLEEALQIGGIR